MDCPNCRLTNPPEARRCDCGYNFERHFVDHPRPAVRRLSASAVHAIGFVFIVCGFLCATVFALSGTIAPGTEVYNIGLLQNRHTGVIGGLELSILGAVLLLYRGGST